MTIVEEPPRVSRPSLAEDENSAPLRPIQYLGNKLRSLEMILGAVDQTASPGDGAADLFSGTSVVAQGLASKGLRVVALDASPACAQIARATLGEGRSDRDIDPSSLIDLAGAEAKPREHALLELFGDWIAAEDAALACRDGAALIEVGASVPQVWRGQTNGPLGCLLDQWRRAASEERYFCALLSPVFAGTYLGIRQAVALDVRRCAVAELSRSRAIDPWQEAVLVTALLAAASAAAFSPGKHFAQPHKIDPTKDLTFHHQRILADRSVDVVSVANAWIGQIATYGRVGTEGHVVIQRPVEALTSADLIRHGVRVVYADPPYTAQQYSRFYHALDTLAVGRLRPLQQTRDQVTGGLYPVGRYLSPYSSKRQARHAFAQLASLCHGATSTLLLSYSSSAKASNGNERMITLTALRDILGEAYGRSAVEVLELDHRYRQFNHRSVARAARADPEILVIARAA
jgi:adenine-specific DNA methylase